MLVLEEFGGAAPHWDAGRLMRLACDTLCELVRGGSVEKLPVGSELRVSGCYKFSNGVGVPAWASGTWEVAYSSERGWFVEFKDLEEPVFGALSANVLREGSVFDLTVDDRWEDFCSWNEAVASWKQEVPIPPEGDDEDWQYVEVGFTAAATYHGDLYGIDAAKAYEDGWNGFEEGLVA